MNRGDRLTAIAYSSIKQTRSEAQKVSQRCNTPTDSALDLLICSCARSPLIQRRRILRVGLCNVRHALFCVGNRGVGNLRLIGLVGLGPASRVLTSYSTMLKLRKPKSSTTNARAKKSSILPRVLVACAIAVGHRTPVPSVTRMI